MASYEHDDGSELYLTLIGNLLHSGEEVTARGMVTRELRGVSITITDPLGVHALCTSRKPNLKIAATEAMHLTGGISSLEQLNLTSATPRFTQFADNGRLAGAYGPRAHSQLLAAERLLREDPGTRQAAITIWKGTETAASSRDVPCTTLLQFFIRGGRLELGVVMRSNDIFLGWPIDIMVFSCLQRAMAASLGLEPGAYRHHAGSLHAYESDVPRLEQILADGLTEHPLGMAQIPLPVPYFTLDGNSGSFSIMSSAARRLCLRPGDAGFSDLAWLTEHVPCLGPGWWFCPECRYAIREGKSCESCERE